MIVAVAGRRIDARGAQPPRFPLERRRVVGARILAALKRLHATVVVSSAACGADLLTLAAARSLGIRRRIILPYRADWFLADSVTDRSDDWTTLYHSLIEEARASGDLVILNYPRGSVETFRAASDAILEEAQRLARQVSRSNPSAALAGLIVWEGMSRGPDDLTAHMKDQLEWLGGRIEQVNLEQ